MLAARIPNQKLPGFSLTVILMLSWTAIVQGQDLRSGDPELRGRKAFNTDNYGGAERYFRLALTRAEIGKASDTGVVLALGNLAEALWMTDQNDRWLPSSSAIGSDGICNARSRNEIWRLY